MHVAMCVAIGIYHNYYLLYQTGTECKALRSYNIQPGVAERQL